MRDRRLATAEVFRGHALSAAFGTVGLGGLLILQTHGWLYLTF